MISKEKFIQYMTAIKKAEEKDLAFGNAIQALNSLSEGIAMVYTDEIATMIEMVCGLMDIEYNTNDYFGDDIQYFIYDGEWGKNKDAIIIKADGTEIRLTTLEELYDYITSQRIDD